MERQHQRTLDVERELSGRLLAQLQEHRDERAELVEAVHQLELRIEELMRERDSYRNQLRRH